MQYFRLAALSFLSQSVDAFVTNVASRNTFGAGRLRMADVADAEVGDLGVGLTGPEVANENIR